MHVIHRCELRRGGIAGNRGEGALRFHVLALLGEHPGIKQLRRGLRAVAAFGGQRGELGARRIELARIGLIERQRQFLAARAERAQPLMIPPQVSADGNQHQQHGDRRQPAIALGGVEHFLLAQRFVHFAQETVLLRRKCRIGSLGRRAVAVGTKDQFSSFRMVGR